MSRKRVRSGSGFAVTKSATKSKASVSVSQETKKILEKLTQQTQETESALLDKIFQGNIAVSCDNPNKVITIKAGEAGEVYGEVSHKDLTESESQPTTTLLEKKLEESEKKQRELEEKIRLLENLLAEKDKENERIAERLEKAVAEQLEKLESSETKRRELEDKLQQLEKKLAETLQENQRLAENLTPLEELEKTRVQLEEKVQHLENLLAEKEQEKMRLLDNLESRNATVSLLEKQLANRDKEIENMKIYWESKQLDSSEKFAALQRENELLKEEINNLKSLDTVAKDRGEEIQRLLQQITELQTKNCRLEEEKGYLFNCLNTLEKQRENLEKTITEISKQLAEKSQYICQQETMIEDLQKRIAALESLTSIADYTLNRWRSRFYYNG